MRQIECVGKILSDGSISLPENLTDEFQPGTRVRLIIYHDFVQEIKPENVSNKKSDILNNESEIWQTTTHPSNETVHCLEFAAFEDWEDWADPEEDIYEDYRLPIV